MLTSAANQHASGYDSDTESLPDPELGVEVKVLFFLSVFSM